MSLEIQADWKTGENLEWCTPLPSKSKPKRSRVFLINDTECYFLFCQQIHGDFVRYFDLYLKCETTDMKLQKPFSFIVYTNFSGSTEYSRTDVIFFNSSYGLLSYPESALKNLSDDSHVKFVFDFEHNTGISFIRTENGFVTTSTLSGVFCKAASSTQKSNGLFGGGTSVCGSPRGTCGHFGANNTSAELFEHNTNTETGSSSLLRSSNVTSVQSDRTVKFSPPTCTDTMAITKRVTICVNTRYQCITCMKEYESKSLEELRCEDYASNRKSTPAAEITFGEATQTGDLFSSTIAASSVGFSFGTTQSKVLFGTSGTTDGSESSNTILDQPVQTQIGLLEESTDFVTTTFPDFNFGGTSPIRSVISPFGQNNQQKIKLVDDKLETGFGTTSNTTTNLFSFGNPNNMLEGHFDQKPVSPTFGTNVEFEKQTCEFGFCKYESLSQDLKAMLESEKFSDVTLVVGDAKFAAHKVILASRSQVFDAMLQHDLEETPTNSVHIGDIEPATLRDMLQYIYTGNIDDFNIEKAIKLYSVADEYLLKDLKNWCVDTMVANLKVENVCQIALLTDLHQNARLKEAILSMFCNYSSDIFKREEWQHLIHDSNKRAIVSDILETAREILQRKIPNKQCTKKMKFCHYTI